MPQNVKYSSDVRGSGGYIVPIVLVVLSAGILLSLPLMRLASSATAFSQISESSVEKNRASEAGMEEAIWQLANGSLADQLPTPGDSVSYSLMDLVNGLSVDVRVARGHGLLADEDFNSATWSGGSGWLQPWLPTGCASVVDSGAPQDGTHHLMLNGFGDGAKRSLDLSGVAGYEVRLYFWAKAKSFQEDDEITLRIGDLSNLTTVRRWVNGDDDNTYRFYDMDITPYGAMEDVWIAFDSNGPGPSSYFYVDSIAIVKQLPGASPATPSDGFESGDWSGGLHWSTAWEHQDSAAITPSRAPYSGSQHMEITGPSGMAKRQVDLSDFRAAQLRFWAKGSHFESGDMVDCLVSGDGITWYSLITWTSDDSDLIYRLVELDMPPDATTATSWVAFQSNMSSSSDFFNVDELSIVGTAIAYEITSVVGDTITNALVSLHDGQVTIHHQLTGPA